jgi:uncharacterized protein YjbI with pentapeptide repeats
MQPPVEHEITFTSLFGYDRTVQRGDTLVALAGEDVPILQLGATVKLVGDSRGYVPGGFEPDEEVRITAFRLPHDEDHIIQVSNGTHTGWLKPGNIARTAKQKDAPFVLENDAELAAMGEVPEPGVADPEHFAVLQQGAEQWNRWRMANPQVVPRLHKCDLRGVNLREVDLRRANLRRADLQSARFVQADLRGADLTGASFSYATLISANLRRAKLQSAICLNGDFNGADLSGADLTSADLRYGRFFDARFRDATLVDTNLMATLLLRVDLSGTTLSGCRVHGAAVWKTTTDERTTQSNLIVTDFADPTVTTDSLAIAQLIHLMVDVSSSVGQVIDSMTGRAVLLLGRFTPERLEILNVLADGLRQFKEMPIIFNFDKPPHRSITETVRILAGLSKFIMADLTDPGSVGYEAHLTAPDFAIPFLPIIKAGQRPFSMFKDLRDYPWVLDVFKYEDAAHLGASLSKLRAQALSKRDEIEARRNQWK